MPVIVGGDAGDAVAWPLYCADPPPEDSGVPLAYATTGEASVGGAEPLKLSAQGVIPRAERRVVGALHLDVERLSDEDVGDGHGERRPVLAGAVGGADDGVPSRPGRRPSPWAQQAQALALHRDLHRAVDHRRRHDAEVLRLARRWRYRGWAPGRCTSADRSGSFRLVAVEKLLLRPLKTSGVRGRWRRRCSGCRRCRHSTGRPSPRCRADT